MPMIFQTAQGAELDPWLMDLARLRIQVFHEFPYCYQGDLENEKRYLETYVQSDNVHCILAFVDEKLVGASTSLPLSEEVKEIQKPFCDKGIDPASVYYFGESVILPAYRGGGTGKKFFQMREEQAQKTISPLSYTAFCGVDRPADHPLRPPGYRNLHAFWQRMGYQQQPEMKAHLEWKDRGDSIKTAKSLTFWLKNWD